MKMQSAYQNTLESLYYEEHREEDTHRIHLYHGGVRQASNLWTVLLLALIILCTLYMYN